MANLQVFEKNMITEIPFVWVSRYSPESVRCETRHVIVTDIPRLVMSAIRCTWLSLGLQTARPQLSHEPGGRALAI